MVREIERKAEHKTGNKDKEKTRQGITNSSSNGSDVLIFDPIALKILIMGYDIQKKSVKISVIFRFHRMASDIQSEFCQICGRF